MLIVHVVLSFLGAPEPSAPDVLIVYLSRVLTKLLGIVGRQLQDLRILGSCAGTCSLPALSI